MPETAASPAIDPDIGYVLEDIGGGVYAVNTGVYITLFAVVDGGVILFDAPPATAPFLPAAVVNVTDEPITHIVYTHSHNDHISAAAELIDGVGGDVEIVSSKFIADKLAARGDPRRPVPTSTFEGDTAVRSCPDCPRYERNPIITSMMSSLLTAAAHAHLL